MAMQMRRHDIPRDLNEFVLNDVNITGTTLGRGAFSVVEELKIGGTLCAGKRPHPELLRTFNESEPGIFKQFREECKLMSKMHHPRIVQFLGLFYFDDSPYPMLVMEKLDVNLDTVLEIYANIPFPLILHVLKDITEGLIYLHNQKPPVMHRDLTARSILIYQSSFTAKISGLGNARLCDRTLQFEPDECLTQVPGSLLYMAPEALELKPTYDCRLDMFSFGHLALFAIIQEFPQHLKPSIFYDDKGHLKGRTEVERREKYIMKLIAKLTEGHRVTKMILQCLHISPQKRYKREVDPQ